MQLHIFSSPEELAQACARFITDSAKAAISERGQFNLALSGGNTPRATYEILGQKPYSAEIDWERVHVFWVDERCVLPDHADSNYAMVKAALLDHVAIPANNVHRLRGEDPLAQAAAGYRMDLAAHFGKAGIPRFDLILLGLGDDGHTASLFPNSEGIKAGNEQVVENYVPMLESWRLTFTYPLINAATKVAFLVSGKQKSRVVKEIIEDKASRLPASGVQPTSGILDWFLDEAAAELLSR